MADPTKVDPIHQFQIQPILPINIGGLDVSFTNSALFMVVTAALAAGILYFGAGARALVPSRVQSVTEVLHEFVGGTLREMAGPEGMRFFPMVFSLFMFILVANLLGLIPYFFTVTSHLVVTAALALLVIGTVIVYGFWRHGFRFFGLFVPKGVPVLLVPLISAIEVISFLSRPLSLSMRLFANMLAGHIMLKVFAGFAVTLWVGYGALGLLGSVPAFAMTVAMTALETLVAVLQAYVFTILTCLYLNDAIHPNH